MKLQNMTIEFSVKAGNGEWQDDKKVEVSLCSEHVVDLMLMNDENVFQDIRSLVLYEFQQKLDIVLDNAMRKMLGKEGLEWAGRKDDPSEPSQKQATP